MGDCALEFRSALRSVKSIKVHTPSHIFERNLGIDKRKTNKQTNKKKKIGAGGKSKEDGDPLALCEGKRIVLLSRVSTRSKQEAMSDR